MRTPFIAFFAAVLSACSGTVVEAPAGATASDAAPTSSPPSTSTESSTSSTSGAGGGPADPVDPTECASEASCPTCSGDGSFDLTVGGEGLAQYEGRTVTVAALEPASTDGTGEPRRPVLLEARIEGGAFRVTCPASLRETFAYPSWGAFIDVDGDGRCTAADVGVLTTYYGWVEHLDVTVAPLQWSATSELSSPLGVAPPPGVAPAGFCAVLFP